MGLQIFTATFMRVLRERIRAYPVDFFVGCLMDAFYIDLGAWFMYELLFKKRLSESFVATTGTSDYMSYVIVGTIIYMFIVRTCLNVSRTLITELRQGTLQSLMLAPYNRTAYFLGNMCLQVFTTGLETFFATIIGLFFGLKLQPVYPLEILAALIISLYAMFSLAMVLGVVMLFSRDTYITQNTLFSIIFLTCGITFPKELLPLPIRSISLFLPVSDVSQIMRHVLLGNTHLQNMSAAIIHLLLVSTVYLIIGFPLMARAERNVLEKMEG